MSKPRDELRESIIRVQGHCVPELMSLIDAYAEAKGEKIGWKIELPDMDYFQITTTNKSDDRYWKSPLYDIKNLPAHLTSHPAESEER